MGEFNVDKTTGGLDPTAGMPETYPAEQVMMSDGETSVEDAIDELTHNKIDNSLNIGIYNSVDNYYTAPRDGYIRFKGSNTVPAYMAVFKGSASSVNLSSSNGLTTGIYVKKGTKLFVYGGAPGTAPTEAYFIGYIS